MSAASGLSRRAKIRLGVLGAGVGIASVAVVWVVDELGSFRLQARYLARLAEDTGFRVEPGPNPSIQFPSTGPYDQRLGFDRIPQFIERSTRQDYRVTGQARISAGLKTLTEQGLFPPYREKSQAGLTVLDRDGETLFAHRYPERVYPDFESVPRLLVEALLFIEDRQLLDATTPSRNPAVNWRRLARAGIDWLWREFEPAHPSSGGSTLATQIEKYRHSPDGRTTAPTEKFRQMASATMRAYLDGENTLAARRRIVVDYLNTVPLAARPGIGEIHGLGDGLWSWYGRDFAELNRLLAGDGDASAPADVRLERAKAFKEALSLLIAQRRPAYYLGDGRDDLARPTNGYLRLMAEAGILPEGMRDTALSIPIRPHARAPDPPSISFVDRKAATALRTRLAELLDVQHLYDLDRLDLVACSTLDAVAQRAASAVLGSLASPAGARGAGLYGRYLLAEGDDPGRLNYSFTLYERSGSRNLLRVQTDTVDAPFDLNAGAKLDLGSTAKLRTLVTYLEIVEALHRHYGTLRPEELAAVPVEPADELTRWAVEHLMAAGDRSLAAMLEAALDRRYSASPAEQFFTGGGVHTFNNFSHTEDRQVMTVREAFRNSVNLVFVRVMRDIVRYYVHATPESNVRLLQDRSDPRRPAYLTRFADREGSTFVVRFYQAYRGKSPEAITGQLLRAVHPTPLRLATAIRSVEPDADFERFSALLAEHLRAIRSPEVLERQRLYVDSAPDRLSLADRGYLAGIHPLELWLAGFLRANPAATLTQALEASAQERQDVYAWLFRTRHKSAQDLRIQTLLEIDAFAEIAAAWRRLGYPFETLTPSYATAIGASADRPAALAELVGIIVSGGLRLPVTRLTSLHFAAATPYETRLQRRPAQAERVLSEDLAGVVRRVLVDVVEQGTARRLKGALVGGDGRTFAVGAKTGTGDHRFDVYGRGGQLVSSRVVNRSAILVFLIDDRFYGVVTAYVHEPYAATFEFTSALAAQVLKALAPALVSTLNPSAAGVASALRPATGSGARRESVRTATNSE